MTRKSNPFGKTADRNAPYATYQAGAMTWKVLKTYQRPDKEKDNQHARWFVLGESPAAGAYGDMGDMYVKDILQVAVLVQATDEWKEHYGTSGVFSLS